MRRIDPISSCSLALRVFRQQQELGHATGFIWSTDKTYLVTNWHVVTGRNPLTLKATDTKTAAEPDALVFTAYREDGRSDEKRIALYDSAGQPQWLVHPSKSRGVDVVALPIKRPGFLTSLALNRWTSGKLEIDVGSPLFVLGYPFAVERFPIWKLATVASEPALALASRPYLLVDTASRPGMSGSPVIRRRLERPRDRAEASEAEFVGVYSGRLHTHDPLDAQLGMVWPFGLLKEILDAGVFDVAPNEHRHS